MMLNIILILKLLLPKSKLIERVRLRKCIQIKNKRHQKEEFIIKEVKTITEGDFENNYLKKGIPLIIRNGAASWPALKKWSLKYLQNHYSEYPLKEFYSPGLVESESKGQEETFFTKEIKSKNLISECISNAFYTRGSPIIEDNPELLKDLNCNWLKKMGKCFLGSSYQSFIGSHARKTPLHNESTSFFHIIIEGKKKWTIIPHEESIIINPEVGSKGYNYTKLKLFEENSIAYTGFKVIKKSKEIILNKGDIIFIPSWVWHEVENIGHGWGVSYRFTNIRSMVSNSFFLIKRAFFSKPSLIKTLYYSYFNKGSQVNRDQSILIPKLIRKKGAEYEKDN